MIKNQLFARSFPHIGIIFYTCGFICIIIGAIFLTPLLYLFFDPAERVFLMLFLLPGVLLILFGSILVYIFRRNRHLELTPKVGSIIIMLGWSIACLIAVYPVRRLAKLNFTQGLFETVSGWTTTGLTVIDVTHVPNILLLWRSIMQFSGGAGLAIIMLAIFSIPVGAGLYRVEGRSDQLVPHVLRSAKLVVMLYSAYAVVGTIGYILAEMNVFDAINHSLCAVSTGGFSTHAESIGYWDSPIIEAVSIPLMILGNMNFLTAYILFRGKIFSFFRNGEIKTGAMLLATGILILFFLVTAFLFPTLDKQLRVAIFETVTAVTTTGYSTVSYHGWPAQGFLTIIILMLIGGETCSTAGGIKKFRIFLLFKSFLWEVRRTLLPRRAVIENHIYQGDSKIFVTEKMIASTGSFFFIYLSMWMAGAIVTAAFGYDLKDSLFEYASSLGTVGLSVGITGPNTPPVILWMEIIGMFLGRLEFFVVFVAIGNIVRKVINLIK